MKKITVAFIAIVAIGLGWYFFFDGLNQPAPSASQAPSLKTASPLPTTRPSPLSTKPVPIIKKYEVIYTDTGYSPKTVTVKSGETIVFKNQSSRSMWTASDGHPAHRGYPTTGGCLGSTFDTCRGVRPSDSWSFVFDIVGTWEYHNHLRPNDTGIVIVEKR